MALEWWPQMMHPLHAVVPGLWDLHLPYEEKVGPQARLPSPVPAQMDSQRFEAMLQSIHQGQIILLQSL